MKNLLRLSLFSLLTFLFVNTQAQVISQFNWDSGSPDEANVGPNATSISGSAIVDAGGVGGTTGLNAGTPKADINMIIPGSPTFDVDGIQVSIDYQRDEGSGDFLRRGSSLRLKGFNQLSVTYRVDDGAGGFNTVSSGNVWPIPNDNTFRTYMFRYDPNTGVGVLTVDNNVKWTNDGPDDRAMYWTGAGDVKVGGGADGTGFDRTFFDNLIITNVKMAAPTGGPVLGHGSTTGGDDPNADDNGGGVLTQSGSNGAVDVLAQLLVDSGSIKVAWTTNIEEYIENFQVLRSQNGLTYEEIDDWEIDELVPAGEEFEFIDRDPMDGINYYKLRVITEDGEEKNIGPFVTDNVKDVEGTCVLTVYPNPCPGNCRAKLTDCPEGTPALKLMMTDATGVVVSETYPTKDYNGSFDVQIDKTNNLKPGMYIVSAGSGKERYSEKVIVK